MKIQNIFHVNVLALLIFCLSFNLGGLHSYVYAEGEDTSVNSQTNTSIEVNEVKSSESTTGEGNAGTEASVEGNVEGETTVQVESEAQPLNFYINNIETNSTGNIVVTLGYENLTVSNIQVKNSYFSDNLITENTPEEFMSGKHDNAFSIEFTGANVKSTLETSSDHTIQLDLDSEGSIITKVNVTSANRSESDSETNADESVKNETQTKVDSEANQNNLVLFINKVDVNAAGNIVAEIGYDNYTNSDIQVEKSYFSDNLVSENTLDKFLIGKHDHAFSIEFIGDELEWNLETSTDKRFRILLKSDGNLMVTTDSTENESSSKSSSSSDVNSLPQTGETLPITFYFIGSLLILMGIISSGMYQKKKATQLG